MKSKITDKFLKLLTIATLLLIAPNIMAQYSNAGGTYKGTWKDLNNEKGEINLKIYPVYQDNYQGHAIISQKGNSFTSLLSLSGSQGYVQGYLSPSVYSDTLNVSVFNCQLTFSGKVGFDSDDAVINGEAVPQGCSENNVIYLDLVRQQE